MSCLVLCLGGFENMKGRPTGVHLLRSKLLRTGLAIRKSITFDVTLYCKQTKQSVVLRISRCICFQRTVNVATIGRVLSN